MRHHTDKTTSAKSSYELCDLSMQVTNISGVNMV